MTEKDEQYQRFLKKIEEAESKGKNWQASLESGLDLKNFREKYGATSHIDGIYCPLCGAKMLYETKSGDEVVCRECKNSFGIMVNAGDGWKRVSEIARELAEQRKAEKKSEQEQAPSSRG